MKKIASPVLQKVLEDRLANHYRVEYMEMEHLPAGLLVVYSTVAIRAGCTDEWRVAFVVDEPDPSKPHLKVVWDNVARELKS